MAENADPYVIEKSKKELGQMEAILGADETIDSWSATSWITMRITGRIC